MIEQLKTMIDESENKPKIKNILLSIATMPEKDQLKAINAIKLILASI